MEEVEDWAETQFHNSGVLGKPTLSIYIPPTKQPAHVRNDGEFDQVIYAHGFDFTEDYLNQKISRTALLNS